MYRFLIGTPPHQGLVIILKPEDLAAYREKPIDDHTIIDGRQFGRPDVFGILTYSPNRNRTRQFIRQSGFKSIPRGEGDLCFNGVYRDQKVMGVIFSEQTFKDFEAKPLGDAVTTLRGPEFGVPNFTIMVVYAAQDRPVVGFLRQMGVPLEKISTDPALRRLWESYGQEDTDNMIESANKHGRTIPRDEQVNFTVGKYEGQMKEEILLAVRGEELAWFAAHPAETEYYRRSVPGEFPPDFAAGWVKVIKTDQPGVRLRIPLNREADGTFTEAKVPPAA